MPSLPDGARGRSAPPARPQPTAPTWIEGHGWDPDRFGRWPTADDLESVVPGRHVAIWAHDHHSLWASRASLADRRHRPRDSTDPDGGLIRRDDAGEPTGVLHESAARLVTIHAPQSSRRSATSDSSRRSPRTWCGWASSRSTIRARCRSRRGLGAGVAAYRALDERGALPLRVHACIREEQLESAAEAGLRSGDPLWPGADRARFGWLKLFADGTLASRTAALLEPIEPEEGRPLPAGTERGVFLTPPDRLTELAARAADVGIATIIHAIGDWGVRAALDALEPTAGRVPLMPRLEHIQLLHPDDRRRFARAGIAASVQPIHLRADAAAARRLWGARAEANGYPWRSIADTGAVLAFGTDAPGRADRPVAGPVDGGHPPRRDLAGGTPRRSGRTRRSRSSGRSAPRASPRRVTAGERDRGRLVPGQRADLVVVPIAALTEPVEPGGALATARPRLVLVDGAVGFEA